MSVCRVQANRLDLIFGNEGSSLQCMQYSPHFMHYLNVRFTASVSFSWSLWSTLNSAAEHLSELWMKSTAVFSMQLRGFSSNADRCLIACRPLVFDVWEFSIRSRWMNLQSGSASSCRNILKSKSKKKLESVGATHARTHAQLDDRSCLFSAVNVDA